MDKHAFGSAGISRNEIETTDESVSRVREASGTVQLVSYKMRQLSAIANWVATYAERALLHSYQLVTVPTYAQVFSCNNR